jgi:crotonobetainyl-CoA:carnitine CoA-transferase CaiB-like acyl-CoA transferase
MVEQAWRAVGGPEVKLDVVGVAPSEQLPSTLPVAEGALACVAAALRAAAALTGGTAGLDAASLAAVVRSEGYLRIDGEPAGAGFAALSRFWPTADGWVRTHGNYPWHAAALRRALDIGSAGAGGAGSGGAGSGGVGSDGAAVVDTERDVAAVGAALAGLRAVEAEQRIVDAGGVAAALRTPEQWLAHPQGRAVAADELITDTWLEAGAPRRAPGGELPLSGVRVLDLTRVIAGPVATRFLGALGADVLRLDRPDRPELRIHRYDGLPGKRSALLDAAAPEGSARMRDLLDSADVVVHGYRPGVLARFGLDAGSLSRRRPGLVVVALSAWGSRGPWGDRRGFDSIVQVATGIAARDSPDGARPGALPGALPCQLLDHGTGYLCAAAALDGLRRQRAEGGSYLRELSLARTAHWLLAQPAVPRTPDPTVPADVAPYLTTVDSDAGPVTTVVPPGSLDGVPLRWPDLPIGYGRAPAQWANA